MAFNVTSSCDTSMTEDSFKNLLGRQREAIHGEGPASAEVRNNLINYCIRLLVANRNDFVHTISSSFDFRPTTVSLRIDISASIIRLKESRDRLRQWMRPKRCPTTAPIDTWVGGCEGIELRPLGVVGIDSALESPS